MKQAILFCLFAVFSISLSAQCVPNEMYRDSAVGIYPGPVSPDNPDGGITESACINAGYEFVLTFKIPEQIDFNGTLIDLLSLEIAEQDAIGGLPEGLVYGCNPDTCIFTPADTLGCMVIFGTATDVNTPGDYPLTIETTINTSIGSIPITFPTALIPGADGMYILTLEEEGNPDCFIVSTDDYLTKNIRVTNSPNPFSTVTNIEVYSDINEQLDFQVFDMLGNVVHQENVEIFQGENRFDFDGTHLSNGIYTFSLSNKLGAITRKIVISR